VLASPQFFVGPLTVLGSIDDGLFGDFRLLAIRSLGIPRDFGFGR
jgi:uncharacterized membrane protein YqgA involved in biofilm formation